MLRLKLPAAIAGVFGFGHGTPPPEPPPRPEPVADACAERSPPALDLEVPFAYAETGLTETGHARLAELGAWLWCHPGGRVVVAVTTEPHYKQPDVERDLSAGRRQIVEAYLHDRGVGGDRLATSDAQDLRAPPPTGVARLNLRGRGW